MHEIPLFVWKGDGIYETWRENVGGEDVLFLSVTLIK